jgi:polyisoprenoid-binding protein YceI
MKGLISVFFVFVVSASSAQSFRINIAASEMYISGETNYSTWEEEVTQFKGSLVAFYSGKVLTGISGLELQIPVTSIKAPRKGMATDTYEALKEKDHPEITFLAKQITLDNGLAVFRGMLTIAGASKEVSITTTYSFTNNSVSFMGTHEVNMSDYNIAPPKALLGTLSVEEKVEIRFTLVFKAI